MPTSRGPIKDLPASVNRRLLVAPAVIANTRLQAHASRAPPGPGTAPQAGREDPRRKEITTELAPRDETTGKIESRAVTGPSDVGEQ
jgi:hypothetical protein